MDHEFKRAHHLFWRELWTIKANDKYSRQTELQEKLSITINPENFTKQVMEEINHMWGWENALQRNPTLKASIIYTHEYTLTKCYNRLVYFHTVSIYNVSIIVYGKLN